MQVKVSYAIHRSICARLDAEELLPIKNSTAQNYIDNLKHLKSESNERFLAAVREMTRVAKSTGNKYLFEASLGGDYLPVYLLHMLSIPVFEQGGNSNWTLANKIEEMEELVYFF